MVDYDTMAGADKFGNLFIVRLPEKVNEDIHNLRHSFLVAFFFFLFLFDFIAHMEDDPTGNRMKWEHGYLNGAPYKVEHLIHFHAGKTYLLLFPFTDVHSFRRNN